MEFLSGELIRELLAPAPRPLIESKAELIFLDGQYLFHYREGKQEHYKLLSPASVRQAFSNEPIDSGWIQSGVVRWGVAARGEWVIMFVPPKAYKLDFGSNETLTVALPGFVFLGVGKYYYIWAISGEAFEPKFTAFHAPLPNVRPGGDICFGNNIPPSASCQTIAQAWDLFMQSEFNGDLANGKSRSQPNDVREKLRSVAKRHSRAYPVKDLQVYRNSIANVVETVISKGSA